jgi:hypothetical protein
MVFRLKDEYVQFAVNIRRNFNVEDVAARLMELSSHPILFDTVVRDGRRPIILGSCHLDDFDKLSSRYDVVRYYGSEKKVVRPSHSYVNRLN